MNRDVQSVVAHDIAMYFNNRMTVYRPIMQGEVYAMTSNHAASAPIAETRYEVIAEDIGKAIE